MSTLTCVSANNLSLITCFSSTKHTKSSSSPKFTCSLPIPSKRQLFERKLKQITTDATETIKYACVKLLDDFVDSTFQFVDHPLLPSQSNFAPVEEETDAIIQNIQGCVPLDFPQGVYVRNGPNPLFGGLKTAISVFGKSSHIWVEGEGMLHALYFMNKKSEDGRSCLTVSYKNRHVKPDSFKLENQRDKPAFIPALEGDSLAVITAVLLNYLRFGMAYKDISNTNIIKLGDKYYATAENHTPYEFDITTLKTIGPWHLHSTWNRPFTSHPKKIASTGEVVIFGFAIQKPYMELAVISADGRRIHHRADPNLDRTIFCHDIGITERYTVILDLPLTLDINRLIRGGPLMKFDKQGYARIGVMPHYGDTDSVTWFEIEPCSVFHIVNCFEKGDEIIMRACKTADTIIPGPDFGVNKFEWFSRGFKNNQRLAADEKTSRSEGGNLFTKVYEWRLNMKTGQVNGGDVADTDFSMDFPFINENYTGLQNKYGYTQVIDSTASSNSGKTKYGGLAKIHFAETAYASSSLQEDKKPEKRNKVEYHKFPEGTFCSGATFVPKIGGIEEDDGWIITFLHNEINETSQVHIIDGKKFSEEAIAKITMPVRVPYGFHGTFMPL